MPHSLKVEREIGNLKMETLKNNKLLMKGSIPSEVPFGIERWAMDREMYIPISFPLSTFYFFNIIRKEN